jgi:AcrR family transcriptional regulator
VAGIKKRARTGAQKLQRHAVIIDAAEALLRQSGFDAMTMQAVARTAGLAKGTSYLYFASREALVLAVCDRLFDRWIDDFAATLPEWANHEQLCWDFAVCYARDPLFIQLAVFSTALLEPQLGVADFIAAKRATVRRVKRLSGIVCDRLKIDAAAGQRLVWRLLTVAGGAAQMTGKPVYDASELPEDVQAFANLADFQTVFMNAMNPAK